jgi:NitT/TauT family transport system ATP-binding protein
MLPLELRGVSYKEAKAKAVEMLELCDLMEHRHKYAMYGPLSGGQLQRVAIARSLVSNPEIILLDEPFGALDGVTRYKMQVLLANIWEQLKSTIIFVTHDIREAVFLGDDVYIMAPKGGKILRHFYIDLPFHRPMEIMKEPKFISLVSDIETDMRLEAGKYV